MPTLPQPPSGPGHSVAQPTAGAARHTLSTVGLIVLLAALYFLTARLGLALSVVGESVTLIWPPSGLSLAALLLFGYRLWPGVTLGALLVNALTDVPLFTAAGMAAGNTLEALAGAWLLNRVLGAPFTLDRVRHVFGLIVLAAAGSTAVAATFGTLSLCLGGALPWPRFGFAWLMWWMGDAMGDLVFAPALLVWARRDLQPCTLPRVLEAVLLTAAVFILGTVIFGGWPALLIGVQPRVFMSFPLIVWAALRFGPRGAALSTLLLTLLALWGTLRGTGPFSGHATVVSHVLLWLYANVMAVTGLALAASLRERRAAEARLDESRERYRALIAQSSDGIFTFDPDDLRLTEANPRFLTLLGYTGQDIGHLSITDLMPAGPGEMDQCIRRVIECGEYHMGECYYRHRTGSLIPVEVTASLVRIADRRCIMVNVRDVTERKRAEADTRLSATVFENTAEAIVIADAQVRIVSVNRAFTELTGYTPEEVLGKTPNLMSSGRHDETFYQNMWAAISTTGHWQGEIWDRRKDGDVFPCWMVVNSVRDAAGALSHYIAIYSDISERKQAEAMMHHLAQHDALTGLANRVLLEDRVGQALLQAVRHERQVALLFIDLDRFKVINDTLGHAVGDELLEAVARRLQGCVRAEDTVARQGGDEFVIVVPDITHAEYAARVAQQVIAALAAPFRVRGYELHVTPSIGIGVYPSDGDNAQALMKNADTAMYEAKHAGGNTYRFYAARMNERAYERLVMESGLRHAIEHEEFVLHYQPQVELATGRLTGVEALLRWRHPESGLIAPGHFIPLAEETGLIVPIGAWVLREACRQCMAWRQAGAVPLRIAVNISARQFWRGNLRETLEQVLGETGASADTLELEITESMLMRHEAETVALLEHVSRLGVRIAIDDFGTGYSSLGYLKRFPIHKLKIDQSFVNDIRLGPDDAAIATAVIALARGLRLGVIAEGVETQQQLDLLRSLGCDEAQGYFIGRPVPAEELAKIVAAGRLW